MKYYYHALAAVLVGGCVLNPTSAAVGLLFVLCAKVAEIYFTPKADEEFKELRAEVHKLKVKSEQESLGKAFGRGNV